MKNLQTITWNEVFKNWREREAQNPGWIACATKVKGWPDWESWRRFTAAQIRAEERDWQIFEFTDPLTEIPQMLIGPYSGWQSKLPQQNVGTFGDLLLNPKNEKHFNGHEGVQAIMRGLPFSTEFIGLVRDDTNQIVCIEGHHRATAIALAKQQGKPLNFSSAHVTIALAHLKQDEIGLLDEVLKRGTSKAPTA